VPSGIVNRERRRRPARDILIRGRTSGAAAQTGSGVRRIVVAITGASGSIYGVRLLEELRGAGAIETHLVISRAGALNAAAELGLGRGDWPRLADVVHSERDIGASIASGSFKTDAMIVAPCSMKTLAAIATGVADSLVTRAADVALKERRRLVLLAREAPLHLVHLRNMLTVTEMGAVVFPPVPAFYTKLDTIEEMVDQTVGRVLDLVGIDTALVRRWSGVEVKEED
jgi:polyprenyl P-hydroxybenzoate/phenylacrylic acid decarboxylase-like protein